MGPVPWLCPGRAGAGCGDMHFTGATDLLARALDVFVQRKTPHRYDNRWTPHGDLPWHRLHGPGCQHFGNGAKTIQHAIIPVLSYLYCKNCHPESPTGSFPVICRVIAPNPFGYQVPCEQGWCIYGSCRVRGVTRHILRQVVKVIDFCDSIQVVSRRSQFFFTSLLTEGE